MKNIHVLPTDKPSRVFITKDEGLGFDNQMLENTELDCQNQNIYITSEEEIKEGDWFLNTLNGTIDKCEDIISQKNVNLSNWLKKIILTTDQDLIKNGVQAIDDDFLEWFVKNPSCEEVDYCNWNEYYKITPKEDVLLQSSIDGEVIWGTKQETLEEAKQNAWANYEYQEGNLYSTTFNSGFELGVKWIKERLCDSELIQRIRDSKSDAEVRRLIRTK